MFVNVTKDIHVISLKTMPKSVLVYMRELQGHLDTQVVQ